MGIGKKKQGTEQEKKDSQKNTSKIGVGKFWAWNSRAVSTTINTLILGYVTFYGTNQLMLSPLVVGIVLMASRITDGVTDLFAGFIVDRTRTKLGREDPMRSAFSVSGPARSFSIAARRTSAPC